MNIDRLKTDIRRHEGLRRTVYKDTEGVATVGIGRNLESVPLTDDEIELLFSNDLRRATTAARRAFKGFDFLDDERQEVLVNMAFNLGEAGLKAFKKMLDALYRKDYQRAADEMMNSKWSTQVGPRAKELSDRMRGSLA